MGQVSAAVGKDRQRYLFFGWLIERYGELRHSGTFVDDNVRDREAGQDLRRGYVQLAGSLGVPLCRRHLWRRPVISA
jgi:hypothetical protein